MAGALFVNSENDGGRHKEEAHPDGGHNEATVDARLQNAPASAQYVSQCFGRQGLRLYVWEPSYPVWHSVQRPNDTRKNLDEIEWKIELEFWI